jgi:predicted Holliday junction resolvase-like endonuclease
MNKTIKDITITLSDGTTEIFSKPMIDSVSQNMEEYNSVLSFFRELLHERDIKYALEKKGREHSKELADKEIEWAEQSNMMLMKMQSDLEKKYQLTLNNQRKSVSGTFVEKFLPYFPEYTYNQFDVIHLGSPFDMLVLNGLELNKKIDSIIFQEVKTGGNAKSIPASNSRERAVLDFVMELNHPKIKYEHWAKGNDDDKFAIVSHDNYYSKHNNNN